MTRSDFGFIVLIVGTLIGFGLAIGVAYLVDTNTSAHALVVGAIMGVGAFASMFASYGVATRIADGR